METLATLFDMQGMHFIFRMLHTFAGLIWIGHLYYLNFCQGGFMAEADAPMKSMMQRKMFPRVLWWFRYGALWTFIIGLVLLSMRGHQEGAGLMMNSYWVNILTGALMATIMAGNVWFVIWPAQKLVIASAEQVATGGQAIAEAAPRAAQATVASRTNVLLSIPMLFFMNAASHWSYGGGQLSTSLYWIITFIVLGAIEFNALKGKTGPMTTVKGVLTSGFVLLAVFILLIALLVKPVVM
ncbi:MAG: urate hydroxylase PuuD [Bdellovibrionaceae bacterium]|nr:urate hydroxylase PuuD [Pseudobdellovibrionaceae bacterium]